MLLLAMLAASAARPGTAHAQLGVVLAGHVGSSAAAPGGVMVDIASELQQGLWGLRVGVGMDAAGTALAPMLSSGGGSSGVWAADLDLGVNVGRIPYADLLFGRSDPSIFLGAGMAGVSRTDETSGASNSSMVPTWTYGARAGLPIASWLGFELEARHRETFGRVAPEVYPTREGWEYRVGVAFRFGAGAESRRPSSARRGGTVGDRSVDRRAPARDARRDASAEVIADRTIRTAERYLGTPYRWGGTSPAQGFDCSGFVQYVFAEQGIALPRVSRDQARAGRALPASLDGLARGDLLFFAQGGRTVDHVAIYTGDGRILHSSSSGRGVRYDELTGNRGRYYVQHLVAVRRVIGDDPILNPDRAVASEEPRPLPRRELPLDEAFEAITGEHGDTGAPPDL